jgi:hypothetical protein
VERDVVEGDTTVARWTEAVVTAGKTTAQSKEIEESVSEGREENEPIEASGERRREQTD